MVISAISNSDKRRPLDFFGSVLSPRCQSLAPNFMRPLWLQLLLFLPRGPQTRKQDIREKPVRSGGRGGGHEVCKGGGATHLYKLNNEGIVLRAVKRNLIGEKKNTFFKNFNFFEKMAKVWALLGYLCGCKIIKFYRFFKLWISQKNNLCTERHQ